MLIALGGPKKPPTDEAEDMDNADEKDELPADFEKAFEEYRDHPSAETLWEAVKSCVENIDKY
jgi:hypothetical protein